MLTAREFAERFHPARLAAMGAIRRMAITLTGTLTAAKAIWQLVGVRLPNGDLETQLAETFTGIGFYARPPATGKPEAIVIMVGQDAELPVVVGVRDEKTRAAIAGALKADETAAFNSIVILHMKADGTIEARSKNGVAVPLALKSDVVAVDNKYANHIHLDSTGSPTGGPVATVMPNAPNPSGSPPFLDEHGNPTTKPFREGDGLADAGIQGTTVLKGE